jgi:hypothetical protein
MLSEGNRARSASEGRWGKAARRLRFADFKTRRASFSDFLLVPRVKWVLKLVTYFSFLILYAGVLVEHRDRTTPEVNSLDVVFSVWAVALWVEQIHQWMLNTRRGKPHFQVDLSSVLLLTTRHPLLSPHYALCTTHCPLLTTHYSPLTTYYIIHTTHYTLLTTHYSPSATYYHSLSTTPPDE